MVADMSSHSPYNVALNPLNAVYKSYRQIPLPSAEELVAEHHRQIQKAKLAAAAAAAGPAVGGPESADAAALAEDPTKDEPNEYLLNPMNGHAYPNEQGVLTGPPFGAIIPEIPSATGIVSTQRYNELELSRREEVHNRLDAVSSGRADTFGTYRAVPRAVGDGGAAANAANQMVFQHQ